MERYLDHEYAKGREGREARRARRGSLQSTAVGGILVTRGRRYHSKLVRLPTTLFMRRTLLIVKRLQVVAVVWLPAFG